MFLANIFTTIIVQPIFNLLVFIYAILPGHNFGLAIIIFTILIRLLLWPLVKKQLRHAKAMRELQPEIKKIKQAAKGDRQKESQMTMELYKEREINPFASLGILIVQLPILIGLYSGLNRIIKDPHELITFSYSGLLHLSWMQTLAHNIHRFDDSLLGVVNLTKTAVGPHGIYWVGIAIAAASAVAQYFQSKQLMPQSKDSRSLRTILSEAGQGKSADQSEVSAAVGRSTLILVPAMVFLFSIRLALALPLYWLTSSVVAYIQQSRVLREDVEEADASTGKLPAPSGLKVTRRSLSEEETQAATKPKTKTKKSSKAKRSNRRRRK
ncbi:MAG TPA: YidC/Oxa1 family membrane protein insertase [Candidatus Saccharimonadales bacterium]|nr:YidC/Oxa1 family membrane protein insertase [Candidatus Saccharimonadales bacterium]